MKVCATLAVLMLVSCGPMSDLRDPGALDLVPPVFYGASAPAPDLIQLEFDEPAVVSADGVTIDPVLAVHAVWSEETVVFVRADVQEPGKVYALHASVRDEAGNSSDIVTGVYGHNPDVPGVLINEFTTQGGRSHPDMVELIVTTGGNMGGLVFYQGTPGSYTERLVFPAFEVTDGDFILVHFKPEGLPEEIDETTDKTASGGLDAHPEAYDFWVPEGTGLSGNNGVISLYERVGGEVLDAVLYSNRTSESDTRYGGFGTKATEERAERIVRDGGWIAEGELVRPEDGVNPDPSTSTRSLCRRKGIDTNTKEDWYVVPTRGATFGSENLEEEYEP